MTSTVLTSIHTFGALLLFILAVLVVLADPRSRRMRAVSILLAVYAIASVALGLAFNSLTAGQILPWIIVLTIATYPVAPASALVSFILLRPNLSRRRIITIPSWFAILSPVVIIFLDLTGLSQQLFSSNLLITTESLFGAYTGGYISPNEIFTPGGQNFFVNYLILFYMILIVTGVVITALDWKGDKFNRTNALILTLATILSTIVSTVFQDSLPPTVAAILSNALLSAGFFTMAIRLSAVGKDPENSWLQNILQDYPMFTKLTSVMAVVLLPTIAFLSFSTFSFFQSTLISTAQNNLAILTDQKADALSLEIEDIIHDLTHLEEAAQVNTLILSRRPVYSGMNADEIAENLSEFEALWASGDNVLTSVILSPSISPDLRALVNDTQEFRNILLVDNHGGLLTAVQNPGSYDFSGSQWFRTVSITGQPYYSEIRWDQENYVVTIAVPIRSNLDQFNGVVQADYELTAIFNSLVQETTTETRFGLVTPSRQAILIPNGNPEEEIEFSTAAISASNPMQDWQTFDILDSSYLLEFSQIGSQDGVISTPWQVASYQPVEQAIEPLGFARTTTLVIAGVMALVSAIAVVFLSQSIVIPLNKLQAAAETMLEGGVGATADLGSKDELGTLAESFNKMSAELVQFVTGLEETIEDRTKDLSRRATQLEASAVVAREAAEVRDVPALLDLVSSLIPEKLGFYHCGIFLLDEKGQYAVLQAANSEGGQRMLTRGHRLQVGRVGVVGYSAGTGKPRIAQDVGADVVYYDNPDMPETKSEIALPLIVRDNTIGVLDIQSDQANAFSQEDVETLQVLADQLALAIDNARLLEGSQRALEELQVLYGQAAASSWQSRLSGDEISYAYDSTGFTRRGLGSSPETSNSALLSKPISFRGQIIGSLDFARDAEFGKWSEEENQLIEDILEQTALALENARLVQQIRLRSDQIRLLQEITAMAASILDEKELLSAAAEKLASSLQVPHSGVVMLDPQNETSTLVASSTTEESSLHSGLTSPLVDDQAAQALREQTENTVISNPAENPLWQGFVQQFTTGDPNTLVLLPMSIRDELIGYLLLEYPDEGKALDAEENDLFNQISAQISTAIESARLFAAEQQGRIAAAALLEITQIASASLDINRVLNQATNRSAQAIQANRCTILLLDEKEKIKPLVSIYASGQALEGDAWDRLEDQIRKTYSKTPLRSLAASLREPAIVTDPAAYTALPLDWAVDAGIHSMMLVPLISQNKVVGTMAYDQVDPAFSFHANQQELAQTIAGQIATTIENANLFEEAVTRAERERQVTEITAKIRASNDPTEIVDTAITELRAALAQSTLKAKQAQRQKQTAASNGNETD